MTHAADDAYPHLARWVEASGWVEIGHDEVSHSFVRALQEGGVVWAFTGRFFWRPGERGVRSRR